MKPQTYERTTPAGDSPEDLFRWHARPGALRRLSPPWQEIRLEHGDPEIADGARVRLRLKRGPVWLPWVAEHRNVRPGEGFEDVQVEGPFALWEHVHEFGRNGRGALLTDRIRWQLPGGWLARLPAASVARDIDRAFRYRHRVTAADLDLHRRYRDRPRLQVAVTGAGGLIGSQLTALLTTGGHQVVRLVRRPPRTDDEVQWDPSRGVTSPDRLDGLDAVVHLAGENIGGGRWTAARMARLWGSRVGATRALVRSLEGLSRPPRAFLAASAVGVYGDRGDEPLAEASAGGSGFLADLGRAWEDAALGAASVLGSRVALLRFGVVVTPAGGFLRRLLPPFSLGLGGPVGSGRQWLSWVSIDDAVAAVLHVLMSDLAGPVNVTAPEPLVQREMAAALGRVLRRPAVLPLPAPAARLALGRMADELLLAGQRARPEKLLASGYRFRHPELEGALRHLLGRDGR